MLVSDYHASILSNTVAMALTLAGPRLWILLKAFVCWIYEKHRARKRRFSLNPGLFRETASDVFLDRRQRPILESGFHMHTAAAPRHDQLTENNMTTSESSHSELGAACDVLGNVWEQLRAGRVQLPTRSTPHRGRFSIYFKKLETCWEEAARVWRNFLYQPMDIAISLLFSAILIGIFVAESTGSVLSASIVSDTVAVASSSRCFIPWSGFLGQYRRATIYGQQCYDKPQGSDGCNYFFSQEIPYNELLNDTCPFSNDLCGTGLNGSYTLDTEYIDSASIGINAAKPPVFRRKVTYAPYIADDEYKLESKYYTDNAYSNTSLLLKRAKPP